MPERDWRVIEGDCVEQMRAMGEASVDAIVCDPPYGLEFMGKDWDKFATGRAERYAKGGDMTHTDFKDLGTLPSYVNRPAKRCGRCGKQAWSGSPCQCERPEWVLDNSPLRAFQAWSEAWATEALRVLKPGGHLLAFGGTRTYHRLACAIEDAGFEIRDTIAWLYGSGFPKSLDVSKAIDKQRDDAEAIERVRAWLDVRRREAGVSLGDINVHMGLASNGGGLASTWTTNRTTRAVPQWDQWLALKALCSFTDEMDAEVWRLNGRKGQPGDAWHQREKVGETTHARSGGEDWAKIPGSAATERTVDVTVPATLDAERWQGWGTALKPAHEPVVMARKPLAGTVAANVLATGCGALNIDACRVSPSEDYGRTAANADGKRLAATGATFPTPERDADYASPLGRWPANVVLDPDAAAMLDRSVGPRSSGSRAEGVRTGLGYHGANGDGGPAIEGSTGPVSRFFYCAKASSAERNAGIDGFEAQDARAMDGGHYVSEGRTAPKVGGPRANVHPTVKPIDLMRWLVRLVTPPDGLVLDPFAGSGTTGCAAALEGFRFVGIEREPEYAAIARARIAWWAEHPDGMELVQRLEAEKQRKAVAEAGQLDLFA